jgi:hypothetical protein
MKRTIARVVLLTAVFVSANSAFSDPTVKPDGGAPICIPPIMCSAR